MLNGGTLTTITGATSFSSDILIEGDLRVEADTGSNVLEVSTNADNESTVAVTGDLTVSGNTTLTGDVDGDGFDNSVIALIDQHGGGTADFHVHGTASTTDPVDSVTPPGGNHLLSYLFEVEDDDFNDAIDYYLSLIHI